MPFQIVRNDITKVAADAIVNSANPKPIYAPGTDAAIYQAAGAEQLLAQRKKIGPIARGQATVTPAFALQAKYIIHTVGPVWVDGEHGEFQDLANCYRNSLAKAEELGCKSIAFPLIATGVYGFPKDKALQIAISEISRFLMTNEMQVLLVVFDRKAFQLSGNLFADIESYIDEHYVARKRNMELLEGIPEQYRGPKERRIQDLQEPILLGAIPEKPEENEAAEDNLSLEETLSNLGETFSDRLLNLIDQRGMTDVEVYKRANLSRKLFSKIKCKPDYKPKKETALALAVALRLDLEETEDLLKRAGIALSPSSKKDVIYRYFISHGIYDIFEVEAVLFQYGFLPDVR